MTDFRVWAPEAQRVELDSGAGIQEMARTDGGWWEISVPGLEAGDDYAFRVDGGEPRPDPRSAWQPHGVHGPSRTVDQAAFEWHDGGWRGVPLPGGAIYELHVGTFTPDGTLDAAAEKLDHLVELGVDFVELLPVNAFSGRHGWGYDGVGLYAVHDAYGGPEALKRFVDAAHGKGLGVLLDVVYNHLGPSGNYLAEFGPYFTESHNTPWGAAVNYGDAGSAEVRRFVIDNALMWLRDYHCDGLRLDAVHAIVDTSALHLLEELAAEVAALSAHLGRTLVLIAESDLNDPRLVVSRDAGGFGLDAQWSDDFHHALHALLTGERDGYYADFGTFDDLATALTDGYVFTGQLSTYRGRAHGRPLPVTVSGSRLLGYLQDHDQVGNRATGERTSALLSPGRLRIGAAVVLTSPFTPMLFMGEEWGAGTPWQYFTDHEDRELADAVRTGRRSEFEAFGWDPAQVPDPQDEATFRRSKLDWDELADDDHASVLDWHRKLLALRRQLPQLTDGDLSAVEVMYDDDAQWLVIRRHDIAVVVNQAAAESRVPVPAAVRTVLLSSQEGFTFDPASVTLAAESVVIAQLVA